MKWLIPLTVLLLAACSSNEPASSGAASAGTASTGAPDRTIKRNFETAIADRIISDIVTTLPSLGGSTRISFLRDKLDQFNQGVDLALVSTRIRQEHALLVFMVNNEDVSLNSSDLISRVNAMTSITWPRENYTQQLEIEQQRLQAAIASRVSDEPSDFDLAEHMRQTRESTQYPDDSFEGRQRYLDALADAMFNTQVDQFDLLTEYEDSSLALFGEEFGEEDGEEHGEQSDAFLFRYNRGELTVNLQNVRNLPLFELLPLAAFYGFPGMESLRKDNEGSLRAVLTLPGYHLGWASYMVSMVGTRAPDHVLDYLYFEQLLTALAWVDLQLHTEKMNDIDALDYLMAQTPYSATRLALHVKEVRETPGRYLAAAAGKRTFMDLQAQCLQFDADCTAGFNQIATERGVLPFDSLSERLRRQW